MKKVLVLLAFLAVLGLACGLPARAGPDPIPTPTKAQVETFGEEAMQVVEVKMMEVGSAEWRIKGVMVHKSDIYVDIQSRNLGNFSFRFVWDGGKFKYDTFDHYYQLPGVPKIEPVKIQLNTT